MRVFVRAAGACSICFRMPERNPDRLRPDGVQASRHPQAGGRRGIRRGLTRSSQFDMCGSTVRQHLSLKPRMKTKYTPFVFPKHHPFGAVCSVPLLLLLGVLASFAQSGIYLSTGSKTTITLNPGIYDITAFGAQSRSRGSDRRKVPDISAARPSLWSVRVRNSDQCDFGLTARGAEFWSYWLPRPLPIPATFALRLSPTACCQ